MPKLTPLPNGPYRLDPAPSAQLRRDNGTEYPTGQGVSLCRCGGSKKKPFCDGTHRTNGFSSASSADPELNKREVYRGKRITLFDNRAICAHAGVCTDNLKSVFLYGKEPWIDPNGAPVQQIIDTVRKCPSGALSYAVNDVSGKEVEREPMVTVTDNGPYAITGGVELNEKFGDGASKEHYTLCRCGASKNKPFCDGSHWSVKFKDP